MKLTDYSVYHLSLPEYLMYGGGFLLLVLLISFLFYNSFIPALFFLPLLFPYYKRLCLYLCKRRKKLLLLQFRDMIRSMSVSMNSGYSLENSLTEAAQEIASLYGTNCMISKELEIMRKKLAFHVSIEDLFSDFARRCQCDDISMFSQVLCIAKRSGGDFISIIRSSTETISEKIQLQRDIEVSISSKRFEQNIMSFMPLMIMAYIRLTSPSFFDSVYGNTTGIFIMSFCLILYAAAVFLGLKISGIATDSCT